MSTDKPSLASQVLQAKSCKPSLAQVRHLRAERRHKGKHVRNMMRATAAVTAMLASAPAIAAWEPTKPVEIVVAAGAGGASDQMARMMQAAIQKNNLMKQPMIVSLKGGASG